MRRPQSRWLPGGRAPTGGIGRRWRVIGCALLATLSLMASGCYSTTSGSARPVSMGGDEEQLRELYVELVDALSRWDVPAQLELTCRGSHARLIREAEDAPILNIGYFGSPADVRRVGLNAATDKLHAQLAPASRASIREMVAAIIAGDVAAYREAVKRVRREGTRLVSSDIGAIDIVGDTATVDGTFTVEIYRQPREVVNTENQAIREDGRWKDCTPPQRR